MDSGTVTWDDNVFYHFPKGEYTISIDTQTFYIPVKDWDSDCPYTEEDGEPIDG